MKIKLIDFIDAFYDCEEIALTEGDKKLYFTRSQDLKNDCYRRFDNSIVIGACSRVYYDKCGTFTSISI